MAIAFGAATNGVETSGNFLITHDGGTSPRAAIALVLQSDGSDDVTSVTYGGTSMTQVASSPVLKATGETAAVHIFFLGASVPSGSQNAVFIAGSIAKIATVITLTADADCEVQDTSTISSDSLADPSTTLSLGGFSCFCAIVFASGQNAPTGITPLSNWTSILEHDFGTKTGGVYRYNTIGTSDVSMGWTQTAEDATALGLAVRESGGTPAARRVMVIS